MVYWLSICSIISILVYYGIMIYLHRETKGYHPIYNAVSDYGVGETKGLFRLSAISLLLGNVALAAAIYLWKVDFSFKTMAIGMLLLKAGGILGVVLFPTHVTGTKATTSGKIHLIFAVIQFTATAIFVFNMTKPLAVLVPNYYTSALNAIEYLVEMGLIGLVLCRLVGSLKKFFGLFERIFLYFTALYLLVTSWIVYFVL